MKNGTLYSECTKDREGSQHITAFTASKRQYGLQIQVAGCVSLHPAQNGTDEVIGIIELNDQTVPVLDARKNSDKEISDMCCIVLFENVVGDTTIVTARLYEDACQVFDLIVECMDHPTGGRQIYAIDESPATTRSLKETVTK